MMNIENNLHTYDRVRTLLAPSGELVLALQISVSSEEIIEGDFKLGFINEPLGYLIYHPRICAGMTIYFNTLNGFEDLGELK